MPNIGLPELAIILVIVLLLFGASRLPKLGKSMGQGIKGFKDGLNEATKDDDEGKQVDQAAQAAALPPAEPVQQAPVQQPVQPQPVQQAPVQAQPVQQAPAETGPAGPPPQPDQAAEQGWTPQPPSPPA